MTLPASPLLTDLYQLTMLQAYFDRGMHAPAVFEFFVRRLPPERNFMVAAGLAQLVEFLESLRFGEEDVAALERLGLFRSDFLDSLRTLRFTGDLDAMPEGRIFFSNEPIARIVAPLAEAQLVESRLINLLHFQTLIASKAARCVLAASGRPLFDFGMRRAHGSEAALLAARATYLAGFDGTATVLAGSEFDIPVVGTMAHSFVQAHDDEAEAFAHFCRSHSGPVVLLIDTYDTETGARRVVELARRLPPRTIHAVRLDSGDLDALARSVRRILDTGGCGDIEVFASGGLDELAVETLVTDGAPIDGFGIGTSLDVSADCPALDCVYKLQEYAGRARRKRSPGKATWPGRKQVYREYDGEGRLSHDTLTLVDDTARGEALLEPVLRAGRRVAPAPSLTASRALAARELERLPRPLCDLRGRAEFEVRLAPALERMADHVDREFR